MLPCMRSYVPHYSEPFLDWHEVVFLLEAVLGFGAPFLSAVHAHFPEKGIDVVKSE